MTPSFHLLSLPPRNFVVIDNDNEDRKVGVDDNVFEDDVCDDDDCGFVVDDGAVDGVANNCGADDDAE